MKKYEFRLRPTDLDLKKITEAIRVSIRERFDKGVYEHFDLSRVMSFQWQNIIGNDRTGQNIDDDTLPSCLDVLQHSWAIDINDYAIPHKNGPLGTLALQVKKILWKILRFYTYRLFYQQREFNSQTAHLLSQLHRDYQKKLDALQEDIDSFKSVS